MSVATLVQDRHAMLSVALLVIGISQSDGRADRRRDEPLNEVHGAWYFSENQIPGRGTYYLLQYVTI